MRKWLRPSIIHTFFAVFCRISVLERLYRAIGALYFLFGFVVKVQKKIGFGQSPEQGGRVGNISMVGAT
jgi:hypothetical protein